MSDNYKQTRIQSVINYLASTIKEEFGHRIKSVYQGDVGMYPPTAFRDELGNDKMAVRIIIHRMGPPEQRTAMGEYRNITFYIIPMVNMVPHFEATPDLAYGELELIEILDDLYEYFRRTENITLGGFVETSVIEEADFDFEQRGDLSLRIGAIKIVAQMYFENM